MSKSAIEIVAEYLKQNGYDGLSSDECRCLVSDLAPCTSDFRHCIAGHKVDGCHEDCGMGCDFHVVPGKRPSFNPDYPECTGDPASCPENEGYGCCKANPEVRNG